MSLIFFLSCPASDDLMYQISEYLKHYIFFSIPTNQAFAFLAYQIYNAFTNSFSITHMYHVSIFRTYIKILKLLLTLSDIFIYQVSMLGTIIFMIFIFIKFVVLA